MDTTHLLNVENVADSFKLEFIEDNIYHRLILPGKLIQKSRDDKIAVSF